MPFSFLQQKVNLADYARELTLSTYVPQIALDGLVRGVDNVRHDVFLSPKFTEAARLQLFRLVAKYGNVEDIAAEDADPARPPSMFRKPGDSQKIHAYKVGDPAEFKRMLVEIHVAGLNRAKSDGNISIDLMARLAVIKFLRNEMPLQFSQVIERCRATRETRDLVSLFGQTEGKRVAEHFIVVDKYDTNGVGGALHRPSLVRSDEQKWHSRSAS